MSWLVVAKVLPPLRGGNPPDYQAILKSENDEPAVVCWDIRFRGALVGWAGTRAERQPNGIGRIQNVVRFHDLPLEEILAELLGSLGALLKPVMASSIGAEIDLGMSSEMNFDRRGRLLNVDTSVDIGDLDDLINLHGVVQKDQLELVVRSQSLAAEDDELAAAGAVLYQQSIRLPNDALFADAFSPHPRMPDLYLHQTWTFEAYRPFPPNSPLEVVEAIVEKEDVITWNGKAVQTFVVAYRSEAGSGITATRDPIGKLWVMRDGTVIKQQLKLSNLRFTFDRRPDDACKDLVIDE